MPVAYRFPSPTTRGIKLIYTPSGFAATERQTVVAKTLKIWVKFGVAAPGPWGEGRNFTPRRHWRHLSCKQSRKQELAAVLSFCGTMSPAGHLTFWQNFVQKFPFPSPSPGAHHVWNLSRPPQALPPKKIWGPPDHPRGRYEGSKFQLPPLPPQIPFVRYRKSSGHGPGSSPATIPEILVNLRAT